MLPDGRHGPGPEAAAHDGRVGKQRLAIGGEQIEAGGDQSADRVRQRHLGAGLESDPAGALFQEAAVLQQPDELLGEERVAARAIQDQRLQVGGQRLGAQPGAGQLGGLLAGEGAEVQRGGGG